jgi:hypothetical protein
LPDLKNVFTNTKGSNPFQTKGDPTWNNKQQSLLQAQQQLQQAYLLNQMQASAVTQSSTAVQQQLEQVRQQIEQAAQTLQLIQSLNSGNKSFQKGLNLLSIMLVSRKQVFFCV